MTTARLRRMLSPQYAVEEFSEASTPDLMSRPSPAAAAIPAYERFDPFK